jgi:hypothetical protein
LRIAADDAFLLDGDRGHAIALAVGPDRVMQHGAHGMGGQAADLLAGGDGRREPEGDKRGLPVQVQGLPVGRVTIAAPRPVLVAHLVEHGRIRVPGEDQRLVADELVRVQAHRVAGDQVTGGAGGEENRGDEKQQPGFESGAKTIHVASRSGGRSNARGGTHACRMAGGA